MKCGVLKRGFFKRYIYSIYKLKFTKMYDEKYDI